MRTKRKLYTNTVGEFQARTSKQKRMKLQHT